MKDWGIVTGAGRGLGAALSIVLAQRGIYVLAVDINTQWLKEKLEEELAESFSERIIVFQADVTNKDTLTEILSSIPRNDHIKFFIPCQRVWNVGKMEDLSISKFEESMRVHVISPLMISQMLIPRMKLAKGRILFTDTLLECYPAYGYGAYAISKAGYQKLGQQLRLELKNTPLSVGSVYPGFVKTEGGLEDGESLCKLSEQNSVQQTGKDLKQLNIENGTYFEATVSARFLC